MAENRWGLKRRPFPTTPNASVYYPATTHEHALAQLEHGLQDDEGLLLLQGDAGTGKTLLAQILFDRVPAVESVFLTNSHLPDRLALLQSILYDLRLSFENASEHVLRLRLIDHCLQQYAEDKQLVLVVDEAQNLSLDLLEELRLLGNLEGSRKAVQVVLLAQPTFAETLTLPRLASFGQRLGVRCQLEPLELGEAIDYLMHHIRWAGGMPEAIFDADGLETLARGSRGIPRLLNQSAQRALALLSGTEIERIDAEIACEALSLLGLSDEEPAGDREQMGRGYEIDKDREIRLRKSA